MPNLANFANLIMEALNSDRAAIVSHFVYMVERRFTKMQTDYANDRAIMTGNHADYWTMRFLRPYVKSQGGQAYARPGHWSLNLEAVHKAAARHADAVIAECTAKLVQKLHSLEAVEVIDFFGFQRFTVRGWSNGHTVLVEQQMIVNVSAKGKLFNQYPARIYVDGKATPAAKLDAAVAA
jgi:hypothetical protein